MTSTRDRLADDLAKVATGDVAAFVRVYEATSRKLFGVIIRILGRGDVADEVLQEVFVRVWMRAGEFKRGQSSPITWLATIARNRALDEKRRKAMGSLDDVPDLLEWPSGEDIAGDVILREDMQRLSMCMSQLTPDQRSLLDLVYFQGLTRETAAAKLGLTPSSVRNSLRASLAQIRGCLEND